MAKELTKNKQERERIRKRLIQLIDESSARDLFEGRGFDNYKIRNGSELYVLYQSNGGRWSFYKRNKLVLDRKDEELVDRFTNKVHQYLEENDISTTTLGGI